MIWYIGRPNFVCFIFLSMPPDKNIADAKLTPAVTTEEVCPVQTFLEKADLTPVQHEVFERLRGIIESETEGAGMEDILRESAAA
jgi:hypothetical protein